MKSLQFLEDRVTFAKFLGETAAFLFPPTQLFLRMIFKMFCFENGENDARASETSPGGIYFEKRR